MKKIFITVLVFLVGIMPVVVFATPIEEPVMPRGPQMNIGNVGQVGELGSPGMPPWHDDYTSQQRGERPPPVQEGMSDGVLAVVIILTLHGFAGAVVAMVSVVLARGFHDSWKEDYLHTRFLRWISQKWNTQGLPILLTIVVVPSVVVIALGYLFMFLLFTPFFVRIGRNPLRIIVRRDLSKRATASTTSVVAT